MTRINDLNDSELQLMESLLGKEFAKESELLKTWQTTHSYSSPSTKSNQIYNCINAVRSQRQANRLKSEKW
jgi:hypothetical protein